MIASCGGAAIAYDDAGQGVPVVFVHGFPHDRTLWAPQTTALAAQARCLPVDLRGFGQSAAVGPFSMDRYADDVACVMDAAGTDRAVIAGLSMGGYVAFAFWRRHRDRVRALVLASTRATADSDEVRERRRALVETARREGSRAVADQQITGSVSRQTREKNPPLVEAVRAMLASGTVDGIIGALEAMMARPDSTGDLAGIAVPVLVVAGTDDALIRPSETRAMGERIPGSRVELIDGAGHLCNVERAAAFNHVLGDFLATLPLV